ncbi:thiamine diphosphokinase [Loktanella salsilacus]|uniref:thiamine diphosphokinase n=1 Tax=Loktanella salsilacus TaxID=195913 RepID=UPI003736E544
MFEPIVHASSPITLLGGSDTDNSQLNICLKVAPSVVAADGGADHALRHDLKPIAVIGDMDSLSNKARTAFADALHHVAEQDSTDFEKCLTRIKAPLIMAAGFLGGRLDHTLAVLGTLARLRAHHVILVSPDDVCVLLPHGHSMWQLSPGLRAGVLPLGHATVSSNGLVWDLAGSKLAPDGLVSSSNAVKQAQVSFDVAGPVLLTLPLSASKSLIAGVLAQVSSSAH